MLKGPLKYNLSLFLCDTIRKSTRGDVLINFGTRIACVCVSIDYAVPWFEPWVLDLCAVGCWIVLKLLRNWQHSNTLQDKNEYRPSVNAKMCYEVEIY